MTCVSVLIPFHNRISWTREALESVLGQTYADFEIILVDDGSTDDVGALRRAEDPRVRYLRNDGRGAPAARNAGLRFARGKYLALLDSDDLFVPRKLEVQVAYMERHPDLALTHTSYVRMDENGRELVEVDSARDFHGRVYPRIYLYCPIASSTVMVRRETLADDGFEEALSIAYDELLWIRLAQRSEFGGIPEPLSRIRVHGAIATHDLDLQIRAKQNILRYALANDRELRGVPRRVVLSRTYGAIGEFYLLQRRVLRSLPFTLRALAAWPLNWSLYRFHGTLVQRYARTRARRLRGLLARSRASSR